MPDITTSLPKDGTVHGAWIGRKQGDDKGDVHVYVSKQFGAVVGQNFKYHDKINFSDMALSLNDGKATFQYVDDKGNPVIVDLPVEVVAGNIMGFLFGLKGFAESRR